MKGDEDPLRVVAQMIPFPRRWHGCKISANAEAVGLNLDYMLAYPIPPSQNKHQSPMLENDVNAAK